MKKQGQFIVTTSQFPNKNPRGYTRTTQRSKGFNEKALEYEQWKAYVAKCFKDQCGDLRVPDKKVNVLRMMIYFYNNRRCDPSNVFKGIEDAIADKYHSDIGYTEQRLYKNDRYTIGSFNFDFDKENPRVEIEIFF